MSLKSAHEFAINQEFRERLKMALVQKALAVLSDDKSEDEAISVAREILRNPEDMAARCSYLVAASGLTDYTVDSAICSAVDSIWNKIFRN